MEMPLPPRKRSSYTANSTTRGNKTGQRKSDMTINKRIDGQLPKPGYDIVAAIDSAIHNLPAQEQGIAKARNISELIRDQAQEHYNGWECRIRSETDSRYRFTISDPQGKRGWWAEFTRSSNGGYSMKTENSFGHRYQASQVFDAVSHQYSSRLKGSMDDLIRTSVQEFAAGLTIEDLWSYIASTS